MLAVTTWNLVYIMTQHLHNSCGVSSARADIKDPSMSKLPFLLSFEGWIM